MLKNKKEVIIVVVLLLVGVSVFMYIKAASPHPTPKLIVVVTAPNGGEKIARGQYYTVKWNAGGAYNSKVSVYLMKGNKTIQTIANLTNIYSSYNWLVANSLTLASDYKVKVQVQGVGSDTSDNYFSLVSATPTPTFTVSPIPSRTATPSQSFSPSPTASR